VGETFFFREQRGDGEMRKRKDKEKWKDLKRNEASKDRDG